MTSSATIGRGCSLYKGAVKIAELSNISGPGWSRAVVDVTSLDSTFTEVKAGIAAGGQVNISGNYLPGDASHQALLTDLIAGTINTYQLRFNNTANSQVSFSAIVSNISPSIEVAGKVSFSATLTVTGEPTAS